MKTMKKGALTFLALVFAACSFAQSLEDGIKALYYEKTKTAVQALEKVVAGKPKDGPSIYWLGQAYLADYRQSNYANDGLTKAKTLYQQALQGGVNDPLIWVGSGQIAMFEGKDVAAAKQQFEQAITNSKGKKGAENADILNAIGRATAYGDSKHGDAQYGVDVLKRAAAIDLKNPDIDINLGVNYLKLGTEHGGDAVQAFTDATTRDPKYAAGFYRVGRIYQGQDNKQSMDEWYAKAIGADQAYAPVYFAYFDYYKDKDVNAAKDYLSQYVNLADKDCQTAYYEADYLFRAGKYAESLAKADSMANGDCKTFDRLNMLYAYDYDRSGDSIKARDYLKKFFSVTGAPQPDDYVLAGSVYSKFADMADTAEAYLSKAIELDTVKANKLKYAQKAIDIFTKSGNVYALAKWYGIQSKLSGEPKMSEAKYYKLGQAALNALSTAQDSVVAMKYYTLTDSVAKAYIAGYPDKPQGYSLLVNAAKKADRDTSKGIAIQPIATANEFYKKDTATTSKNLRFLNDYYLVFFYLYHEKASPRIDNYKKARDICNDMMTYLDPASDSYKFAESTSKQLTGSIDKFEKGGAKPATGGGGTAKPKPASQK